MTKKIKLKVGSKIIERGKVYKVYKISETQIGDNIERVIHYKLHFKSNQGSTIDCSIPECNIEPPDIRFPVTKDAIDEVLASISNPKKSNKSEDLDINGAKTELNANDIFVTADVIKRYYKEQNKKGVEFPKTKRDLLESAIDRIVEEIALVCRVSPKGAREKVSSALEEL